LTHGIHFTPLLITAHDNATHLFQGGTTGTSSLQLVAECGDISGLVSDLGGEDADTVANPAGGVLAPGTTAVANLDTTTTGNTHLSLVAMLLPTNDGFVGADSLTIPEIPGTYVFYLNGYDAGTEANSELLDTSGCSPGMPGIPAVVEEQEERERPRRIPILRSTSTAETWAIPTPPEESATSTAEFTVG
jgi:hypothetical protein